MLKLSKTDECPSHLNMFPTCCKILFSIWKQGHLLIYASFLALFPLFPCSCMIYFFSFFNDCFVIFRYEPVLVQEMLTLIIQIIKERRFCGLTTAESLKRELIYKLSTGDATHSQLVKSLPRDLSKFEQLQDILDAVAVYSNPSGFNQVCLTLVKNYHFLLLA